MADVNLFSDDVVIILGAGASVPFGLPTGLDLIERAQKRLEKELKATNTYDRPLIELMSSTPIEQKINAQWLSNQSADSIDDLIRHNPQKAITLKQCIAIELLECTTEEIQKYNTAWRQNENFWSPKDFSKRQFPLLINGEQMKDKNNKDVELRNWVHNFVNIIRDQISEGKWSTGKKVKIVSFNYDGIVEAILGKMWTDSEIINGDWEIYFDIAHPHGRIDLLSEELNYSLVKEKVEEQAKQIAVIHDNRNLSETAQEGRDKVNIFMPKARVIFAIGFAFAKSNCQKILGMEDRWATSNREIHYINFDRNIGLDTRVKRFETGLEHLTADKYEHGSHLYPMSPLKGDYLQITDALMGGFLSEMPS